MNRQQRNGAGTPGSLGASYASRLANNSPRSPHGDASSRNILSLKSPASNKDWKSPNSTLSSRTFTNRLDPQVYTDTQSRGLTARLASYYERERLTTPIVNRLYNRAGEFPVVHFHKNELTNSPRTKQNGAGGSGLGGTVRIPAPERTTYQSTMRSEILRTGATVGNGTAASVPLAGGACDDTTVPNEPYEVLAPLDALKEISRKRIHCDEAASNIDSVKKQRADDMAASEAAAASESRKAQQLGGYVQSKRPRDRTSPTYNSSGNAVKQKRPNTKNNDVLSSLSSSVRSAAAAASFRKQNQSPNNSTVCMAIDTSTARPSQAAIVDESVANDLPDSRFVEVSACEVEAQMHQRKSPAPEPPAPMVVRHTRNLVHQPTFEPSMPDNRPQLTLFNSIYTKTSANALQKNADQHNDINVTVSPSTSNDKALSESDDDTDEDGGMSYVKPRAPALDLQQQRVAGQTMKTVPQAKSKLALMLSCLSGDLDEDDQVDSSLVSAAKQTNFVATVAMKPTLAASKTEPIKPIAISFGSGAAALAVPVTNTADSSTLESAVDKPAESEKPAAAAGDANVTAATVASSTSPPNFSFGSKATNPAKPVIAEPIKPVTPGDKKKGGFAFDPMSGVAKSPVAIASNATVTSAAPILNTDPSVPNAFTFGATMGASVVKPTSETTNTTTATSSTVTPAPAAFSFGASSSIKSSVSTTTTSTVPAKVGFSFGGVSTSTAQPNIGSQIPTNTTAVATNNAIPVPSFGTTTAAATTTDLGAATIAIPAPATPSTFSFGAASKIPVATFGSFAAPPTTSTHLFASAVSAATTTAAASTTLNFGGTNATAPIFGASAASSIGSGKFSFGGVAEASAATTKPAETTATTVFGASTTKPSLLATPAFGQSPASVAPVQPTGSLIFGGTAAAGSSFAAVQAPTTTAAAISFGKPIVAAPAALTGSSSMFSFGGGGSSSSTTFGMPTSAAGPVTTTAKPFAFGGGAGAVASTTSVFGSTTTSSAFGAATAAQPAAPIFGAAAAAPVFGATSSAAPPSFGSMNNNTSVTSSLPTFGSVATNNSNTTSVFGNTATSVFGHSSANSAVAPTAAATSSVFGSPAPLSAFSSSSSTSSFGGLSNAASAPSFGSTAAAAPSMFAANAATVAKPFAFGSASGAPSFGAAVQQPQQQQQQQQTSSAFSFGGNSALGAGSTTTNNTNAASPFSFGVGAPTANNINTPVAASPFAFGTAAAPNATTGTGATFGFGGAAAASKIPVATSSFGGAPVQTGNPPAASPFSFGGGSAQAGPPSMGVVANTSSPFAFGGGGSSSSASTATPGGSGAGAFNFGGGAPSGGAAPMGGMNLFSATPANGGMAGSIKGRPFRQATRRINK